MQLEDFSKYTSRCFNGEPASCSCACPFGLDVRSFAEKCANGRWNAAWKAYRTATVFPAVVAALCPAPCREHCQRAGLGGAIDLPGLEADVQYAMDVTITRAGTTDPDTPAVSGSIRLEGQVLDWDGREWEDIHYR